MEQKDLEKLSKKAKYTPSFVLKKRARFFANRAMTKFEEQGGQNPESDQMAYVCLFWSKEVLKKNPKDKEALFWVENIKIPFTWEG